MEERIAELENALRRMKAVMFAGLLVVAGVGFTAFAPAEQDQVLRVRGLVITDAEGRERILIGAPAPPAESRVRTNLEKAREAWASRFPDPDQYMAWYRDYSHETNGIVILDEAGFDRVVLGDPVPDPNIGKRIGPSTGLVINDEEGFERSGYGLLDVDGRKRVVLGLDSDRGTEGLTLFLYDEGRVGIAVRDETHSIFMGNAPAGDAVTGVDSVFSGLVFREGREVTRVVRGQDR